jgi:hypothetical protein
VVREVLRRPALPSTVRVAATLVADNIWLTEISALSVQMPIEADKCLTCANAPKTQGYKASRDPNVTAPFPTYADDSPFATSVSDGNDEQVMGHSH